MLRRLSKGLVARVDAAGSVLLARLLSSSPLVHSHRRGMPDAGPQVALLDVVRVSLEGAELSTRSAQPCPPRNGATTTFRVGVDCRYSLSNPHTYGEIRRSSTLQRVR